MGGTSQTAANQLSIKDIWRTLRPQRVWLVAIPFVVGFLVDRGNTGLHLTWMLAVGSLYFLLAYPLTVYGLNDLFERRPRLVEGSRRVLAQSKRWPLLLVLLFVNVPFVAYFWQEGGMGATLFLLLTLSVALLYATCKTVPVFDAVLAGFLITAPFLFGIALSGTGDMQAPAWLAFLLWAMATYSFGAILDSPHDQQAGRHSIAVRFGSETTLVFCMGLYVAAAGLPLVYYGWLALPVTVLLFGFAGVLIGVIPQRAHAHHPIFKATWRRLELFTFLSVVLVAAYLVALAASA